MASDNHGRQDFMLMSLRPTVLSVRRGEAADDLHPHDSDRLTDTGPRAITSASDSIVTRGARDSFRAQGCGGALALS